MRFIVIGLGLALALLAESSAIYKARLSPLPADARTRSVVTGIGSVTGTLSGTKLTITGSFEGLRSPATMAQVREGSVTGVRGTEIFTLMVTNAMSGSVSGSFDLTPQQVESFRKGRMYVQIDSEKVPDGNLWGWLLP
ncbi:MAG TPA: CHRD domain-containing protein [Bryobacteraceae bacterium]|nr:CHRD domain-containing protein [Bryobacteraceae bacterium]